MGAFNNDSIFSRPEWMVRWIGRDWLILVHPSKCPTISTATIDRGVLWLLTLKTPYLEGVAAKPSIITILLIKLRLIHSGSITRELSKTSATSRSPSLPHRLQIRCWITVPLKKAMCLSGGPLLVLPRTAIFYRAPCSPLKWIPSKERGWPETFRSLCILFID